jgi:hypothetical protein
MIHENSPDDLRAEREEVDAAFAVNTARPNQLQVGLICKSSRLECVARLAAAQMLPRNSTHFRVNQRHHSSERLFIAWWDGDGLCLFAKRLERGRFIWPQADKGTVSLSRAQLSMLLEGIDWRRPIRTAAPAIAV